MQIKRLGIADVSSIISLGLKQNEFQCTENDDFWSTEALRNWLKSSSDICAGAIHSDGNLVGYCLTHLHKEANKVHIENIYVVPKCRRYGVGKKLIEFVRSEYSKRKQDEDVSYRYVGLVLCNNEAGYNFFHYIGFNEGRKIIWFQDK